MSTVVTLASLLEALAAEGLVDPDLPQASSAGGLRVRRALKQDRTQSAPWFVRVLLVVGTWVGAVLVAMAVVLSGIMKETSVGLVLGPVAYAGAIFLSRTPKGDVLSQGVLVLSLAGQLMFLVGAFAHGQVDVTAVLLVVALIQAVGVAAVEDAVHRFISTLALCGALYGLGMEHKMALGPDAVLLLSLCAGTALLLYDTDATLLESGVRHRQVAFALLLFFLAVESWQAWMFLDVHNRSAHTSDGLLTAFPRLATAVITFMLAWVVAAVRADHPVAKPRPALWGLLLASTLVLAVLTAEVPAIMACVLLLVLSLARGEKVLQGMSSVFLVLFLAAFYRQLNTPLLQKSLIVVASGALLLVVRSLLVLASEGTGAARARGPLRSPAWKGQRPLVLSVALGLALVGGLVVHKELIVHGGETVYLRLAPVDPRSLMQGDYMRLAYEVARDLPESSEHDGDAILVRDPRGVARLKVGDTMAPGEAEVRIRYRKRGWGTRLGADSYLFQEGDAALYQRARYGELRVSSSGESVLIGLRDDELRPLGPRFLGGPPAP